MNTFNMSQLYLQLVQYFRITAVKEAFKCQV